jgi:hypothetical protein
MRKVQISGVEFHSANTQQGLEDFLIRSGLIKTLEHRKAENCKASLFISWYESLGYKQLREPDYSAKYYSDGWGICVRYYYEPDAIATRRSGRMPAEEFEQAFLKKIQMPVGMPKMHMGVMC